MAINIKRMKEEIKNSSASKSKILFFKEGTRYRIRFLDDFEEGYEIPWHSQWESRLDCPCQEIYGRECPYCDDESISLRTRYAWSVYDCESKEIKILLIYGNRCSPAQVLAEAYEKYGTLKDREYEIKQLGSGTSKTFSLFPGDKHSLKAGKKPLSEKAILKYIDKAYPAEGTDEEEEEEKPRRKTKSDGKGKFRKNMNPPDDWEEEEEEKPDYDSMKPIELYRLCVERDIDCEKKKSKQYYIDLLEQYDDENDDDWEEEEEESDWDEPEEDEDEELPFR